MEYVEEENRVPGESRLPDHNPKYDLTDEQLAKANEKIGGEKVTTTEEAPAPEPERAKIKVGNKVIYVRTDQEYHDFWDSFLINAAENFEKHMGYGVDTIKRIGIRKFIDAYDWIDATQVTSFLSDKLKVMPCVHCQDEFAVAGGDNYGLCEKCEELYDLAFFEQLVDETNRDVLIEWKKNNPQSQFVPAVKTEALISFLYDPKFRHMFLKSVLEQRDKARQTLMPDPLGLKEVKN